MHTFNFRYTLAPIIGTDEALQVGQEIEQEIMDAFEVASVKIEHGAGFILISVRADLDITSDVFADNIAAMFNNDESFDGLQVL